MDLPTILHADQIRKPPFDHVAVGDRIAALEIEARNGLAIAMDRSVEIAAILWDVKKNHKEHLDAICERAGIGLSRRKELFQVGRGSKTIEESRAQGAARQARSQAKLKAAAAERPSLTAKPASAAATVAPPEKIATTTPPPAAPSAAAPAPEVPEQPEQPAEAPAQRPVPALDDIAQARAAYLPLLTAGNAAPELMAVLQALCAVTSRASILRAITPAWC